MKSSGGDEWLTCGLSADADELIGSDDQNDEAQNAASCSGGHCPRAEETTLRPC